MNASHMLHVLSGLTSFEGLLMITAIQHVVLNVIRGCS